MLLAVFASFSKVLDFFGPVRMHSDASGGVQMHSDTIGNFRTCWSEKCNLFEVFARFSKVSDSFGPVRTCSDVFRCIRMHPDAFGFIGTRSEKIGKFGLKNQVVKQEGKYYNY